MSEAEPDTTPEPSDASDAGSPEPSLGDLLLRLQELDTEVDQIRYAEQHHETTLALADARAAQNSWTAQRDAIVAELAALAEEVEVDEREDAELHAHRVRLDSQMKLVIAPREAEALMHEMATIDARRNELDDAELVALERESVLDDELTAHLAKESTTSVALSAAEDAARDQAAYHAARLVEIAAASDTIRSQFPSDLMNRYDRLRNQFGVAAARLDGRRCEACHLDLSAGELDMVRSDTATTGFTDCPNCGRLLVVLH